MNWLVCPLSQVIKASCRRMNIPSVGPSTPGHASALHVAVSGCPPELQT